MLQKLHGVLARRAALLIAIGSAVLALGAASALAATITVTTVADDILPNDGSVSLREAITAIDAGNDLGDPNITAQAPGTFGTNDTINFNIPGAGVQTINVGTDASAPGISLPAVTLPVLINGYTQGVASTNTLANGDNAVLLIELNGTSAGAGSIGLLLAGGNSTVQGLVINRFNSNSIGILVTSNGNMVAGNFIGTDPTGTTASPNDTGVLIQNAGTANNTIGGTAPADRNLISGNNLDGIDIEGHDNFVEGNFIGTDAAGTAAVPNTLLGVQISVADNNTIGGTAAGSRNVIAGNGTDGIAIKDGRSNVVQGNFLGVGADGVTPLGNSAHGIAVTSFGSPMGEPGAQNNQIGGTVAGAGNLIEFNGTAGVAIFGNPLSGSGQLNTGNAILGNSLFMNGRSNPTFELGIDLVLKTPYPQDDGVTPNDPGDADPGPNNLQNFPILSEPRPIAGATVIQASLNSTPNTTFRIEFFVSQVPSQTGFGEGQTFVGFTNVTTGPGGDVNFTTTILPLPPGAVVTATATDPAGNTSEFSPAVAPGAPAPALSAFGLALLAVGLATTGFVVTRRKAAREVC